MNPEPCTLNPECLQGVQLVKRLAQYSDKNKQRAEVAPTPARVAIPDVDSERGGSEGERARERGDQAHTVVAGEGGGVQSARGGGGVTSRADRAMSRTTLSRSAPPPDESVCVCVRARECVCECVNV